MLRECSANFSLNKTQTCSDYFIIEIDQSEVASLTWSKIHSNTITQFEPIRSENQKFHNNFIIQWTQTTFKTQSGKIQFLSKTQHFLSFEKYSMKLHPWKVEVKYKLESLQREIVEDRKMLISSKSKAAFTLQNFTKKNNFSQFWWFDIFWRHFRAVMETKPKQDSTEKISVWP